MTRYYLIGITSSEGIDKNFNPTRNRVFYNNYKDKEEVAYIYGDFSRQGYSSIVTIYVDAFVRNNYEYMRNNKKYHFNVFILDICTLQVVCFDIKTLLDHLGIVLIDGADYIGDKLTLSLKYVAESDPRFSGIIAKTKEFDTVFTIKANMMKKPFFVMRLEAVNGVEYFNFNYQNYTSYDEVIEAYTKFFNSSFTLGFYTKEAVRVATITTSYFQAFFLYFCDKGISTVYDYKNGITKGTTCYLNHAFGFMNDENKIYLARQATLNFSFLKNNCFFIKSLTTQPPVQNLGIPALVEIYDNV